ncbi:c-type cytochrome [Rhodobacteraceae bacterium CY05]|uniref:C-type cytochrome n=2 Tax=Parasedimentitalea huanghaiensis TaxID=2682100 RepID=A0A6L6WM46_9RHOB|nr:c-type cytochrome [Zongyanglinia huanghaiensis]MVO17685.1 c-type cytochrome [Zongyanglinia huanghaiensis]
MKFFGSSVALGVAVLGTVLWSQGTAGNAAGVFPYQDDAAVAQGKVIYQDNCASCHGDQLQGEANWRERDEEGYLPAPPHNASGHTWHHADQQLLTITRKGTAALVGNGYRSRMEGYEDVLSESDLLAVFAYIKSTWPAEVIARHNEINEQAEN